MLIKESAENYLEAILMIKREKGVVRSIDVANRLGFSFAAKRSFRVKSNCIIGSPPDKVIPPPEFS